ncbi:macrophage colony-stimulating factor 1 isoform X2 [Rhea pennata]|uniref:macrophage colony-stimulating factor 1 isoform X2 n=1 Tax=Rhea pennata TaxID=8795 RepID=UPI002E26EB87
MARSGAEVCLLRCTLLSSLLFLLVCSIHETEQNSYCQQIITQDHLAELQELADTQMQHPGRVSFTFIDKVQLDDPICYVKAAFPLLGEILEKTEFKENSSNAKKLRTVRRMYRRIDENVDPCIRDEDDEERELSQKCFREFATSPYEMLALVKQFFHDLDALLQTQETFAKDCSHVYRKRCPEPEQSSSPSSSSSPGVGTDPDGTGLSPALPSATQPSLSAGTPAGRLAAAARPRAHYGLPPAGGASGGPAQPPAGTDGGSGTEEAAGAWPGEPAAVPALRGTQRPAPGVGAEPLPDPPGTVGLAAEDVSIPPRDAGSARRGPRATEAGAAPAERPGAAVLPEPAASARSPAETPEPGAQLRFSRMAEPPERPGGRRGGWQPSRLLREPQGAGPSLDSRFVPSAEQRRKEPKSPESRRQPLPYVAAASVVAVLLAVGGLLFYKYKCRVLERRLDESERDPEEPERRALRAARDGAELEMPEL